MGRAKARRRNEMRGIKNINYKSRTSASYIRGKTLRAQAHIGCGPFLSRHSKRTSLKSRLTEQLGLPKNALFIFRHSSKDSQCRKPIIIYHGTVVVINAKDLSLVLVARCTPFKYMSPEYFESLKESISIAYKHARARNKCLTNHSVQPLIDAKIFWGWLGGCGWRGGMDEGKSLGVYAVNNYTSAKDERIDDDQERMKKFRRVRDFFAERFASLSLATFEGNKKLALRAKVPGLDELDWQTTPNGLVFASNLVVTCDNFFNTNHTDNDHTRYATGINCLIDRDSGEPYQVEGSPQRGRILGANMVFEEFGVEVNFERCDGSTELVWDTKTPHYTRPSISADAKGNHVPPEKCAITRFGSSCQINESLVRRISLLEEDKAKMSDKEWEDYRKARVKSYEEETSMKKMRLIARKALDAEKRTIAAAARLAKEYKKKGK